MPLDNPPTSQIDKLPDTSPYEVYFLLRCRHR